MTNTVISPRRAVSLSEVLGRAQWVALGKLATLSDLGLCLFIFTEGKGQVRGPPSSH